MSEYPVCYAGYSLSENRKISSSGGFFALLAKYVLEKDGVVFGATIDKYGNVYHKCVDNKDDLIDILGSKYAQSNVGKTYSEVQDYLKEGRLVLFCGTPCQTNALYKIVGESKDNLILVDFICHGVPNPEVLKRYIKEMSCKKDIKSIYFRDKENGWQDYQFKIVYQDDTEYKCDFRDNEYMYGFINNLYLRPSCYDCRFKGIRRVTDFTMGDFWGIQEEEPELYDSNGVSVILVQNQHADDILSALKESMRIQQIDINKVIKHNPSLVSHVEHNIMEKMFYHDFFRKGLIRSINNIWHPNKIYTLRNKLYRGILKLCR